MIQLIVGGKGSGKTKKMIDMINDSAKTTPGNIVCIEKSMKLTYDIDHAARLIDVDEMCIRDRYTKGSKPMVAQTTTGRP